MYSLLGIEISVVIPHHRDESFLLLAVQSAAAQLHPPLEIIVVNDDFAPLSPSMVHKLQTTSNHVRIIETGVCSGGPASPRNLAVRSAIGRYIAFLDSDDQWLPSHLSALASVWKLNPDAILHGHQICWGQPSVRPFVQSGLQTKSSPRFTLRRLLLGGNRIFLSSVGAPRSLLSLYPFDPTFIWEDFELWLRLASDGYDFVNSNSYTTLYQIRAGSRSGRVVARRQGAKQLVAKYFPRRPHCLLPLWLLRNLYA